MGAWIETTLELKPNVSMMLLPLWEHGLKHNLHISSISRTLVAPFMGAWIETPIS